MKFRKVISVLFLLAAISLYGCGEQESPTIGETEQEAAPGQTAMDEQEQPGAIVEQDQQQPGMTAEQEQEQFGAAAPQEQPGQAQPQEQAAQMDQQQAAPAGGEVEIAGTVERTSDGYAIRSVDQTYMVEGRDLSDMVGQDVKVTGSLEEAGGRQTITVDEVTVIE